MESTINIIHKRTFLSRICYGFLLTLLIYAYFSHGLVSQLQSPSLIFSNVDITYIFLNATGFLDFITTNYWVALSFDILLFASCFACLLKPNKTLYSAIFLCLYFLYTIIFSNYGGHHLHSKVGALLILIPFLFKGKSFAFMWEGVRYYTLFFMVCAFLWKFFRGSWIAKGHGVEVIQQNWIPILYRKPNHLFTDFYCYLFNNPHIADILFTVGSVLEGIFIVGFFTKKYDKILCLIFVALVISFQISTDAFMFELLILAITFIFNNRTSSIS